MKRKQDTNTDPVDAGNISEVLALLAEFNTATRTAHDAERHFHQAEDDEYYRGLTPPIGGGSVESLRAEWKEASNTLKVVQARVDQVLAAAR